MEVSNILKKANIDPNEPVLLITAEEAMKNLLEAIEEYCPDLQIDKITKDDLKALLNTYSECVINYHPENYHQERGALLNSFKILEKYGLTDDDCSSLDFS